MSKASYKGVCLCGGAFKAGASVKWGPRTNGKSQAVECPSCHPDLHSDVEAAGPVLTFKVKVQRIRFAKPDGWTVTESMVDGGLPPGDHPVSDGYPFAVVGMLGKNVQLGDLIEVYGNFEHGDKYGWQFKVTRAAPVVAGTDQALRAFLSRFPQVGPKRAEQILQKLGSREAVIDALEKDPLRLMAVSGITESRALDISKTYKEKSALNESALLLAALGLGEKLNEKILDTYGADAKAVLLEDPYQLMELEDVAFATADEVATKLATYLTAQGQGHLAVTKDDPRRLAAATLHLLWKVEAEGHTWSLINDLMAVS